MSRLSKEKCIGPGGKPSSQKSPCESVVGQRQRVAGGDLPNCNPDSELFVAIRHMEIEQTFALIRVIYRKKGCKDYLTLEPFSSPIFDICCFSRLGNVSALRRDLTG